MMGTGVAFAQNAPLQGVSLPAGTIAPQVSVADVQAFMANPNTLLAQFPTGGPELQARIEALLAVAAANGLLPGMMTAIQSAITAGALSPAQIVAIAAGANAAAAALAAAGETSQLGSVRYSNPPCGCRRKSPSAP